MNKIRKKIEQELLSRGVKCSTQAISALCFATAYSSPEIVGCSDSILLGLLRCGSYTIDALIDSGVNTKYLKEIVASNVIANLEMECDPIEMLFAPGGVLGAYLSRFDYRTEVIETSNLLEIAISPESLEGSSAGWFPKELRSTPTPTNNILKEIENQVCHVIDLCIEVISKRPDITLRRRKKPLTNFEKEQIIGSFSEYIGLEEANWALSLTDEWITERKLGLERSAATLKIINSFYQDLRFGSSMFLDSGGDFSKLSFALKVAKRFAPERDQPLLGFIERDGRVYIKQYSYRNSAVIDQDHNSNVMSIGAETQLPFTTSSMLFEFEELINNANVREENIQKFLEAYPEIIESLGYASCKPHVIMRESGKRDLIPDFILQRPGNNGFDILDLKLPTGRIAVKRPFYRISYEITKALAQLRAYRNFFKSSSNTSKFHRTYGLEPLSPELIVVIGRSSELLSFPERKEINKQASGLRIISYDELIDYGKARAIYMPKFDLQ